MQTPKSKHVRKGNIAIKVLFPYSLVEDERALRDFITECL